MATFKIVRPTAKGKSWKAVGVNPKTGRKMTIQGGQSGVKPGPKNQSKGKVKSFKARHGKPSTPKQYINMRRWNGGGKVGSTIRIPHELFKK